MSEENKLYTFWELLKNYEIIIPKIQRDYAQGREDKKVEIIRNTILDDFEKILLSKEDQLNLDFVYGSNENSTIIPLDGQQRLTTLFLLHLYLSKISGNFNQENQGIFKKFKYEIRSSTQKFINALIENELVVDIENQPWFFNSWKKDPSVKGMLVMLKAIHEKFQGKGGLWEKLIEDKKITFYFLPLNKFKLTDELYVKMNSRGKPLSEYENFKAWLDEKLTQLDGFDNSSWSFKLDTIWTDLFWNLDNGDNSIDEEMMNFFRGIALFNYMENFKESSKSEEFKIKVTILNDVNNYISNKEYQTLLFDFNDKNDAVVFKNITDFLDFYSKPAIMLKVKKILKEVFFWEGEKEDNSDLFIRFLHKTDFKSRTLFYGLYQYILLNNEKILEIEFKRKFRILRNLVENTDIGTENIINVLNSVKRLMKGDDIINQIGSIALTGFYGNQIEEEKLKAELVKTNPLAEDVFSEAEHINFFRGRLEFAFFCCDITNKNIELKEFIVVKDILKENFNRVNFSNDIRRALLIIEGNDFYDYWRTWSYTTNTHKRCLIENTNELKKYFVYGGWRHYLKNLVLKIKKNTLSEILTNYQVPIEMPNWKIRLIKEPDLIDKYCQSYYFGFDDNHQFCYLFKDKKRPSSTDCCEKIQ